MCAKLNLSKLFKPSFVEKFGYVSLDLATKFQARTRGCPLPTPYPSFLSLPLLPFHHPIPFPALPSPPHSPPKIEFGAFQPEILTSGGNKFNDFPENQMTKFQSIQCMHDAPSTLLGGMHAKGRPGSVLVLEGGVLVLEGVCVDKRMSGASNNRYPTQSRLALTRGCSPLNYGIKFGLKGSTMMHPRPPILSSAHVTSTFCIPVAVGQCAFTVTCTSQVRLKFVAQFLRNLAERDFLTYISLV